MTALDHVTKARSYLRASDAWRQFGTKPSSNIYLCDRELGAAIADLTPAPTPTPPPPTAYLFSDEFDGPAGAPPDPAKWVNLDGIDYGGMTLSKAANAYLDGSGHLVLKITREQWRGKPYAGASVGSYQYQTGWPPLNVKGRWTTPFRYEVMFKMPNVAGAWVGPGWNQNVDRPTSQAINELDCGESRSTLPTVFGANQHQWLNGADVRPENGSGSGTDGRSNWHVMAVEARTDSCVYLLDGAVVATHGGVSGTFGVQLHNQIADAGTWASGGAQPDPTDPGPWTMLVDYVRVSAL